tara:strand:+ start:153 stop:593 length:441 start_codon:yes stop_codon:yes gene_type:complete
MATTTAAVTLTSDLLSDNMSVSASTTCMKAGTTADGLDMIDYGIIEVVTGDQFDLLDADDDNGAPIAGLMANKANKVYIKNHSIDETYFVSIMIDAQDIGKLYAGDWMFIPWNATTDDKDIEITASGGTNKIEYALFHQGKTLTAS